MIFRDIPYRRSTSDTLKTASGATLKIRVYENSQPSRLKHGLARAATPLNTSATLKPASAADLSDFFAIFYKTSSTRNSTVCYIIFYKHVKILLLFEGTPWNGKTLIMYV